jgi:hypothetical protein
MLWTGKLFCRVTGEKRIMTAKHRIQGLSFGEKFAVCLICCRGLQGWNRCMQFENSVGFYSNETLCCLKMDCSCALLSSARQRCTS